MGMDCCLAVGERNRRFGKPENLEAVLGQLRSDFWFRVEVAHSLHGPADLCRVSGFLCFASGSFPVISEGFLFCPVILH